MKLKDVTGRFDSSKFYKGKYKKFECNITILLMMIFGIIAYRLMMKKI